VADNVSGVGLPVNDEATVIRTMTATTLLMYRLLLRLLLLLLSAVRFRKPLKASVAHLLLEMGRIRKCPTATYRNIAITFYRGK